MDLENYKQIPNSLEEHWMPFTANRDYKENPRLMVKAEGVYYTDHHGTKLIDASSGLFCSPAGHSRPEIREAVSNQLEQLDYVQPFQQGYGGSFELARLVSQHTPEDLNKIFFTICGSSAVETAIKTAIAYFKAKGEGHRSHIVGRERGYHGMNIGGISVGGMVANRKTFSNILMPNVHHLRHTHLSENKFVKGQPETGSELADDLERIAMNIGPENIAACIVEPVAGSTGTLVPPKGYLKRLRKICDKYGILLIFDEVITGWGRTGEPFASQAFEVTPDIMTMAKAITNGVVPLGAVASKEKIYDTIIEASPSGAIEFFHGYTYSAIPVSMAAGLAMQKIIKNENLFQRAKDMSPYFLDNLFSLKDLDIITDIRGYGMMGGIDIRFDERPGKAGYACFKKLFEAGLSLKATGDCLIVAPPFICEKHHIDEIIEKLRKGINLYMKDQ
ncbi:MAG: Beta-alanine--pyruvate aminotransferase [Alphaproteobacteria bacterium MarineAlpha5_Bin9]|nr:MAG: Beta-alanine--pyruvate aminotransferase [Alphaproteobacteria bacterium MarineAlpha5_Bin9]|tara:strand:- start:3164 stop:4504 length:1341 start_codon:yes stop_codon:yes gene_type:complete